MRQELREHYPHLEMNIVKLEAPGFAIAIPLEQTEAVGVGGGCRLLVKVTNFGVLVDINDLPKFRRYAHVELNDPQMFDKILSAIDVIIMNKTTTIDYRIGDAANPLIDGNKIIAHICNDQGAWGKGFVLAVSKRWSQPAAVFRSNFNNGSQLGDVQFVAVEADIWVANMISQHGIGILNGIPPIRYEILRKCLVKVADFAKQHNATVCMPRIGCGLAGGEWSIIESIIISTLCEVGIKVIVYDITGV